MSAMLDSDTILWIAQVVAATPYGDVHLVTHAGRVVKIITEQHERKECPPPVDNSS